jgi:hypothetical protein
VAGRRWRPRAANGAGTISRSVDAEEVDSSHLADVEDGCGCAGIWEYLSGGRGDDADE